MKPHRWLSIRDDAGKRATCCVHCGLRWAKTRPLPACSRTLRACAFAVILLALGVTQEGIDAC